MFEELQIRGMRELFQRLDGFPEELTKRVLVRAVRAGAIVIRDLARSKVASVSGRLRRSIRVQISAPKNSGWVRGRIVAGRRGKPTDPYYAHFVEFGTKAHEIRPKKAKSLFVAGLLREQVNHPGSDAKPFLGPALKEGAQAALNAMAEEIRRELGT